MLIIYVIVAENARLCIASIFKLLDSLFDVEITQKIRHQAVILSIKGAWGLPELCAAHKHHEASNHSFESLRGFLSELVPLQLSVRCRCGRRYAYWLVTVRSWAPRRRC